MRFIFNEAEKIICAVIFLGMTAVGFANVVVRYLTHYSLASTEELLTNGFLLLTVFGAAIAARRGEHLAVTLLVDPSVVLATRQYCDDKVADELNKRDSKQSVRVATTAAIALAGLQTIDGVVLWDLERLDRAWDELPDGAHEGAGEDHPWS